MVKWLTENMRLNTYYTVSAMHGEMDQHQCELIMWQFCSGFIRVLITTDVLARGIDVQLASLVINYDFPSDYRFILSSRFGHKGVVINFMTSYDKRAMKEDIEWFYNTHMLEMPQDLADLL